MSGHYAALKTVHHLTLIGLKPVNWQRFAENRLMYGELKDVLSVLAANHASKRQSLKLFSARLRIINGIKIRGCNKIEAAHRNSEKKPL